MCIISHCLRTRACFPLMHLKLFDRMFQRYTKQRGIKDIRLSVVEINGINEKYFFHVIYKEAHSFLASVIGHDLKEGFDK